MSKVFHVAAREFAATVTTRGFIIGLLFPPVIGVALALLLPLFISEKAPRIVGKVAVFDPTGKVIGGLRAWLAPEAMVRRREDLGKREMRATPQVVRKMHASEKQAAQLALQHTLGEIPKLTVVKVTGSQDIEREKQKLIRPMNGGESEQVAVVVVHPDAVEKAEGKTDFGSYQMFVRHKLDERISSEIGTGLREAIVEARISAAGLERARIESLLQVERASPTTVTETGENQAGEVFNALLPAAMMLLLLMSALIAGQSLMTTTIEEKSSRVAEVLLSAVSPMQLMAGKILGQMTVGLLVLVLYAALGMAGLFSFAMLGLLDWWLLAYLMIFFLIAYFFMASMMGAVGAAVNDVREAQSFMIPIMLVVMTPWILWMPISRDPNSTLAVVLSFIPPVNPFVMMLRLGSTTPPPAWQVWLSIGIGAVAAYCALWTAAKIFRVGLLMYGKPPSFATLIRWIRAA